ncbi:MAG: hypothetical protein V3V19_11100 [Cocleimonas sp.]
MTGSVISKKPREHCICGKFTPKEDGVFLEYCSEECWSASFEEPPVNEIGESIE